MGQFFACHVQAFNWHINMKQEGINLLLGAATVLHSKAIANVLLGKLLKDLGQSIQSAQSFKVCG